MFVAVPPFESKAQTRKNMAVVVGVALQFAGEIIGRMWRGHLCVILWLWEGFSIPVHYYCIRYRWRSSWSRVLCCFFGCLRVFLCRSRDVWCAMC